MKHLKLAFVLVLLSFVGEGFGQTNPEYEERVGFAIPKTIYFTGEKIWLSIQVESLAGAANSRIGYAELWNRYGESVALAKVPLESGLAFNFLQLPDDLPSDQYLLRVFTRVSPFQNLEEGLVQEFVTVFNPRIPPEVVADRNENPDQEPDSPLLSVSSKSVQPGGQLEITYSGSDSLLELAVAVANPFLSEGGKISSKEIYESIETRKVVPEFYGHIIEAKIRSDAQDSTISGLYYLSLHGEKSALFTDRPDGDGSLFFDAGGLRHWDYLIAQGRENQPMNDFEIISPSPQTRFRTGFQFPKLQISPSDEPLLKELLRGGEIEEYFVQEFQNEPIPVVTGFVEDRTFILDDYNRFEDVETHIKEYVPEVSVRTREKNKELRVLNVLQNRSFTENPLLLVDAMPVFDAGFLLGFNPAKFEKMEILSRPFFLNEEIYPGVVSFSSFQNDFGGFPLPTNAVYVPYPGIQPPVTEHNTLFGPATQESGIMDWRTILYWSPASESLTQDNSWSVTAPLVKGVFQVKVKTRDSSGKVKEEYATFEVK
ncbi:hypothetical protein [Algoriphagus terrigena]|uniref:hypothetical protein n=1 Tax=Algoriphagus terrigena TaxID=344884 RepID=UPI00047DD999|nr:hypothetical protein [Algoriphagus terrigena]